MKWVVQTFSLGDLKKKRNEEEREVGRKEGSRESRMVQRNVGKESARDEQKYCQTEARGGFDKVENMELSSFQVLCYVVNMQQSSRHGTDLQRAYSLLVEECMTIK